MNALILLWAVCGAQADDLPGAAFRQPPADTVLRTGPGESYPGLIALDGRTVVRVGAERGAWREVFVAAGYPVYLARGYVEIVPQDAAVRILGERLSARYVPTTAGNLPVGHIDPGTGPLVLLDEEGAWVRVLAPLELPLYAHQDDLAGSEPASALGLWRGALGTRETRRAARAEAWRANSPEWQAAQSTWSELQSLADVDLTRLTEAELDRRAARLALLEQQAPTPETAEAARRLVADHDYYVRLRERVAEQRDELGAESDVASELAREARVLGLGLRFSRYGESVTVRGRVETLRAGDAVVYTLQTEDGELLKLTAPPDVADLAALASQREVTLTGRRLQLNSVSGPVLVVNRVLLSTR